MSLCIPQVLPFGAHKESVEADGSQYRREAWIDMLCESPMAIGAVLVKKSAQVESHGRLGMVVTPRTLSWMTCRLCILGLSFRGHCVNAFP